MRGVRIVVVGNFAQPWTTETYVARELSRLGHEVIRKSFPRDGFPDIEAAASVSQLLVMQGSQLPDHAVEMFRRVEARGCVTAGYHLDIFRGLAREGRVDTEAFWRMGHVFTADGDPDTQAWMAEHGVNHHWLPAACVTDEIGVGQRRDSWEHDVVFVGSRNYHAEWPWRRLLLQTLAGVYGAQFRAYDGNAIRGIECNDLYASARVVVGDSMFADRRRNYWSDRYYETIGRGGFLVAPHVDGLEAHLVDTVHFAEYTIGSLNDVCDTIDFHLAHWDHARDIAQCGLEHVRAHHTYRHRMIELLDVVGLGSTSGDSGDV